MIDKQIRMEESHLTKSKALNHTKVTTQLTDVGAERLKRQVGESRSGFRTMREKLESAQAWWIGDRAAAFKFEC